MRELDPANRVHLTSYVRYLELKNLTESTIKVKLWRVYGFLLFSKFKDAKSITPRDVEDFMLYRKEKVSPFTLQGDILELTLFLKWLLPGKADKLITFKVQKPKRKLPVDQLITRADIQMLISSCDTQRDRALIMLLWDSGARINEVLSRNMGHIQFDRYGAVMVVNGKTGERRLRLTSCVPDLQAWVNVHPMRDDPGAPLFITYNRFGSGKKRLHHHTVQNRLKVIAAHAGVKKRVHPHGIRHARITDLAKKNFSEMELRIIAGWEASSLMPATYVHLSGADVESKVLKAAGIIEENERSGEKTLEIQQCPRCKGINAPDAKYCKTCSLILDEQTAIEVMQAEEQAAREPQYQEVLQELDELRQRVSSMKR